MSDLVLEVQNRELTGKNNNRRLRVGGEIPAVVYGSGIDPAVIQVQSRGIDTLLKETADHSPVFLLRLAGTDQSRHCMIRDLQTDAITGEVLHIDFQRVDMKKEIHVSVRIELHGIPAGVKNDGGLLDFVTREVEMWGMPDSIPGHLNLDVSALEVGQHLEASHLELPEGSRLGIDADRVIVSIHGKQVEEEVSEDVEEEEAAVEA